MRSDITPGQTSDYLGFDLVMDDNLPEPSVLLADRGYDSDKVRETMEARNVVPVIPMRKSRKLRVAVDRTLYRLRNRVERCFNKLKNARRVATRYDKTAESFLGFIDITSIRLWLRHLSTRPSEWLPVLERVLSADQVWHGLPDDLVGGFLHDRLRRDLIYQATVSQTLTAASLLFEVIPPEFSDMSHNEPLSSNIDH